MSETQNPASGFVLDPQLDNDTHEIGSLGLSRVLLMNDARFPWLILVPQRPGMAEIVDLAPADRLQLWHEISQASEALRGIYAPDKLNIGALGNMVRQLHVHVVARFASDAAWPKPVWGSGQPIAYEPHQMGIIAGRLAKALGVAED
jgi:diadenosine tetraphosphate (Ap4A) HIT family hydrolase